MEIQEYTALKSLKRNLESSVERILSKHENINDNTEIPEEEFENIVDTLTKSKEINLVTKKFFEYYELSESGKMNFMEHLDKPDLYDETELEYICHQIAQAKSLDSKYKALELLLKYPVLDLIDKYKWPKISKLLRENLFHRNKQIFEISLKIHIKLASHPQGIIEATINILKVLNLIFHSRRICGQIISIDFKNPTQEQIMKLTNVLLNNFKIIFKNYSISKERHAENLISQFMELLICHKDYDRSDYIHMFYYVFVLDPTAKWFRHLMHSIATRRIIINFCYKNHAFFKYIVKEIINYTNNDNENVPKKTWTTEISLDILKYAAFYHCSNILSIVLSYKWGHRLFPVEIKSVETNMQSLIMNITTLVQNLSNCPNQHYKREILTTTLKTILINNRHFLYNKDIIHTLIKPFLIKIQEKQKLVDIARKNMHVLQIINAISKSQDAFFIIFGFADANSRNYKRRHYQYIRSVSLQEPFVISTFIDKYTKQHHCSATERDNISIAKVIVDYTTNIIRYHVNSCEKTSIVDDMVYELLECCCNIHLLHTHVLLLVNSQKLLHVALDLYKVLIDHNLILNSMNSLLKFFIIMCETRFGVDIFLKEDTELLYILCKHYFFIFDETLNSQRHFMMFVVNLANTVPGCIAITECKRQIISPYLNKIWKIDEDELLFLCGSGKLLDEEAFKYYKFIFTLHLNFNCVQALLSNDSDDDSTLIETDGKASNLKDLIDETMNTSGPGTVSCFVGLQTIRLLINNMDVLIFLENTADLKEQVSILQAESSSILDNQKPPQPEYSFIYDECSVLRQNIIDYIQNIGVIISGNSKSRSQQRLQSTTVSARNRRLNEFQRYLNDARNSLHDHSWVNQAKRIFRQSCGISLKDTTFADLVQQVRLTVPNSKNYFIWPDTDQKSNDLFPEDIIGINIIVRFGKNNKLLQGPTQFEDMLYLLLKQVNSFLNITRDKFEGFDWFVGVIFLLCGGSIDRSKIVLQCMVQLPIGPFIWRALGLQLGLMRNFDYSIHFDQTLNRLIGDLEIFKSALEEAGISWNFIVRNWINQCFFNILPWSELCNFLCMIILFPVEYMLFFTVCCAQHLELNFLRAITSTDINNYQNIMQMTEFYLVDYFSSLEQLEKQYKNILARY